MENETIEMVQGIIAQYREDAHKNEKLALEFEKGNLHFYYDGRAHAFTYAADMLEVAFNL